MLTNSRALFFGILFACGLAAGDVRGQNTGDTITYTIQADDTLCLISTRFYNAPSASGAIYAHNKSILDSANRTYPHGPQWIFPGTVIELPSRIILSGIRYDRRSVPMSLELAKSVAKPNGITLDELIQVSKDKLLPAVGKTTDTAVSPFPQHKPVFASQKAIRESVPDWYQNPDTGLEQCAKAVCKRYLQLCYFECLSVAKRIVDGDQQGLCEKIQRNPQDSSIDIPYEVNQDTRTMCSELVE